MASTDERNARPFATAFGIWFVALMLLAVGIAAIGGDPVATGAIGFDLFAGTVALAIWARRAPRKWSLLGYGWRFVLCGVVASVLLTLLSATGRVGSTVP